MILNPNRSIIICTRHEDGRLTTTYCNGLDDMTPYLSSVTVSKDSKPVGLDDQKLPDKGETKFYPLRWTIKNSTK